MTPYVDTWCLTCRTWHSSVWVHIGDRVIKVNDIVLQGNELGANPKDPKDPKDV